MLGMIWNSMGGVCNAMSFGKDGFNRISNSRNMAIVLWTLLAIIGALIILNNQYMIEIADTFLGKKEDESVGYVIVSNPNLSWGFLIFMFAAIFMQMFWYKLADIGEKKEYFWRYINSMVLSQIYIMIGFVVVYVNFIIAVMVIGAMSGRITGAFINITQMIYVVILVVYFCYAFIAGLYTLYVASGLKRWRFVWFIVLSYLSLVIMWMIIVWLLGGTFEVYDFISNFTTSPAISPK